MGMWVFVVFFFKQKTAYEMLRSLVGSEMCIRDSSSVGINIMMISTSEIKTSCVIDEKFLELGVRVLHDIFELDKIRNAIEEN